MERQNLRITMMVPTKLEAALMKATTRAYSGENNALVEVSWQDLADHEQEILQAMVIGEMDRALHIARPFLADGSLDQAKLHNYLQAVKLASGTDWQVDLESPQVLEILGNPSHLAAAGELSSAS